MPYSLQRAVSDGTLRTIPVSIKYFDKTNITVFVDDVLLPNSKYTYVWSANNIVITPNVAKGSEVLIKRTTKFDTPYHDFSAGAVFKDSTVDDNFLQMLFIAQETSESATRTDFYADLNFHGYRLRKVGNAIEPDDAVPFAQYRADALGAFQQRVLAEGARNQALAAAASAEAARDTSVSAANSAAGSVSTAAASASQAAASASTALGYRNEAETFKDAAAKSATQASNSATAAATSASQAEAAASSVNNDNLVHKTGTETITGSKTFAFPVTSVTPTADTHLATKGYVDYASIPYRNRIINGAFDIWQRGTSTNVSNTFAADRWLNQNLGNNFTASRQTFPIGQTDVPFNPKYFYRMEVLSVANAAHYTVLTQRIEGVRTFAGKTVTLSFYAKADAPRYIAIEFEQFFGIDGSPSANVFTIGGTKVLLSSVWTRYSVQVQIPSIAGKTLGAGEKDFLGLNIWLNAGSSLNSRSSALGQQSGTFDFSCIQLEEGTIASPFEYRPYGIELALCQRYYEVVSFGRRSNGSPVWGNSTPESIVVSFKQEKRVMPTIAEISGGDTSHARLYYADTRTVYVSPPRNSSGAWYFYDLVASATAEL